MSPDLLIYPRDDCCCREWAQQKKGSGDCFVGIERDETNCIEYSVYRPCDAESKDPNEILGPTGYGDARWVAPDGAFTYTVRFENMAEAEASAQIITITHPLDAGLDWSTFQFGSLLLGNHMVEVPGGLTDYHTQVDLRPEGNDLIVDIQAHFDEQTGLATWTFTGIDPETGELTEDPLAGFLPPNNPDTQCGEGFVSYSVQPRDDLASGAELTSEATIVFDWNEPIDTPVWRNTIDAGTPSSAVDPLPAVTAGPEFQVSWTPLTSCVVRTLSAILSSRTSVSDSAFSRTPFRRFRRMPLERSSGCQPRPCRRQAEPPKDPRALLKRRRDMPILSMGVRRSDERWGMSTVEAPPQETTSANPEILRSLLQVGVNLASVEDFPTMLSMILTEARRLAKAQAGSLYVVERGKLRLAVAQNDRIAETVIQGTLLNREFAIDSSSLVGYVAGTGQVMNIPNTFMLPAGAPFRINREADNVTSYRARSILAIPLSFQASKVIGAIELINRTGPDGRVEPFPDSQSSGLQSLAAMAAVTVYNAMLRDELKRTQLETIMRLSVAAEFRDNETAAHLRRLSHTSALIAQAMGLPPRQVDLIRFASPMHDVGKIGISDSILCKPGRLTDEERQAVQAHPAIGAEILGDPMNDLVDAARAVAMTHHEKWDGTGYPNHLKGEEIPLIGRITGLADVFDALVSKRCYKDAMSVEQALDIVRAEEGKHFDPAAVKAFFLALEQILEFYKDPANQEPTALVA